MCVYMFEFYACNGQQCRNIKLCSRVGHAPSHTNNITLCSYYDTHMTATIDSWLSDFSGVHTVVISEMGKNLLPSDIVRRPAPCKPF